MTITCKICAKPKHPSLYRPSDVKRHIKICRECRKVHGVNAQPNYWRESNATFFGKALAEGRTH